MIPAGASPHEYTLRPSEAAALQNADLVFWMGEDLTPWLEEAVETLAEDATVTTLLELDETELLDFREGALFEAHDHSDHEGHDDHDDHGDEEMAAKDDHDHDDHGDEEMAEDDHDHDDHGDEDMAEDDHDHDDHGDEDMAEDDHGHGHGDIAFEWAGLFDLAAGTYSWSFAKVDGDYADPAMKMVILATDDIEEVEETAEELLEAEASDMKADGETLMAKDMAYTLTFDAEKEMTVFSVDIAEAGTYAFFTEHMPFEFEADEHFFKDTAGVDVEPIAEEGEGHGHGHDHGHGHGHDHGAHDPHAWLSPHNATAWLNVIAARLSAADPGNAGAYFANAAAGIEEIEALEEEIAGILDPVRGKSFIVFHDAYQYFETDFDFPASGAISLGDAVDPSPARIAEIQDRVQDEGVDCVLSEPQFNPGLVAVVMDGTDANTGVLDPLGSDLEPGKDMYPQLLRNLATTLADCL
ncbi:MAG: zinc ABC transporter substrate-binding protein [Pseudomonadota bacterium]